jgi:hypothetical protein
VESVGCGIAPGVLALHEHAPQISGNSSILTFRQASSSVSIFGRRLLVCNQVILAPQE